MDICTVNDFREALAAPEQHFRTINSDIKADLTTLCCTTHFAECKVLHREHELMLYAPITSRAMKLARRAQKALMTAFESHLRTMMILRSEMKCHSKMDQECPIIVEDISGLTPLDKGLNLSKILNFKSGIEELAAMLKYYDISHNNLTTGNILFDDNGRLYPIRQYYTTMGFGGDNLAFGEILTEIMSHIPKKRNNIEELFKYDTKRLKKAHIVENRQIFNTERGLGYKNERGKVVIEDIYSWATDFYEGRAVIGKNNKFGVIDRDGKEILPLIYDHIDYDRTTCGFKVLLDKQVAEFNYSGEQITEWELDKKYYKRR